jgi:hypothetical protein
MFDIFAEELSGQQIPQIPEQDVEKKKSHFPTSRSLIVFALLT